MTKTEKYSSQPKARGALVGLCCGAVLSLFGAASAAQARVEGPRVEGPRVEGHGPYHFGMSAEEARQIAARAPWSERWYDLENGGGISGGRMSRAQTAGRDARVVGDAFGVVLNFNRDRRLYQIELHSSVPVATHAQCLNAYRALVTVLAEENGPLTDASAAAGMQRLVNGRPSLYVGFAPENTATDSVIAPTLETTADGSRIEIYHASVASPDMRQASVTTTVDEIYVANWREAGENGRSLSVEGGARPLSALDDPGRAERFECTASVVFYDPALDTRPRAAGPTSAP